MLGVKPTVIRCRATIRARLRAKQYRVTLADGCEAIAFPGGPVKRLRFVAGDRIVVEFDSHDARRGRIIAMQDGS